MARCEAGRIVGEVLSVDRFGNLATNITTDLIPADLAITIHCGGRDIVRLSATYGEHSNGSLIALVGSDGCLELAVTGGNAAETLGVGLGAPVEVTW